MTPEDQCILLAFHEELLAESDRGAALVGTAFLDQQLTNILRGHFISDAIAKKLLEGSFAPLSSFSARILAAQGLGLISRSEADECNLARKIRNLFAHQVHGLDFDSPTVSSLTTNLTAPHPPGMNISKKGRQLFNNSIRILTLAFWYRPEHSLEFKSVERNFKFHLHFDNWYPDALRDEYGKPTEPPRN